jgi:hypothetical protein
MNSLFAQILESLDTDQFILIPKGSEIALS